MGQHPSAALTHSWQWKTIYLSTATVRAECGTGDATASRARLARQWETPKPSVRQLDPNSSKAPFHWSQSKRRLQWLKLR
jgi:hypothetical protein